MLLIFSRNVGLKTWDKVGNLSRELTLYNKLIEKKIFKKIFFFTYDRRDVNFSNELKSQNILSKSIYIFSPPIDMRFNFLNNFFCLFYFIFLFLKISNQVKIIKTNQIDGSYLGVFLKILYKKKLYIRSGYNIIKRDKILNFNFIKKYLNVLQFKLSLKFADEISVSNLFEKRYYSIVHKKNPNLIYNYIDTSLFYNFKEKRKNDFLYIGRISKEKNISEIINVFKDNPNFNLDLYGQRKNSPDEVNLVSSKNINFYDPVPNNLIPNLLNKYKFLILLSNFEGLSKTVIEGMSCGIFCIVSNLIENKFLIKNNLNGYILKKGSVLNLKDVLDSEKQNQKYVDYNQNFVHEYFSFEKYLEREISILNKI